MANFLDFLKLKDYIPQILEVVSNGQVLIDGDADLSDRAVALVNILDLAADYTDTEWDDDLVERIAILVECEDFWQAVDVIIECLQKDHDHDEAMLMTAMDEKGINPSTIVLLIEVAIQIFKLFQGK